VARYRTNGKDIGLLEPLRFFHALYLFGAAPDLGASGNHCQFGFLAMDKGSAIRRKLSVTVVTKVLCEWYPGAIVFKLLLIKYITRINKSHIHSSAQNFVQFYGV